MKNVVLFLEERHYSVLTVPASKSWSARARSSSSSRSHHRPNRLSPLLQVPKQDVSRCRSSILKSQTIDTHGFSEACTLLNDPTLRPGQTLETALNELKIEPTPRLLLAIFRNFDSSPKLLQCLYMWAEKKPGFVPSAELFDSVVDILGKAREFDAAWSLIHHRIGLGEGDAIVSSNTFAVLIRRFSRAGLTQSAISTFEYASNLDWIKDGNSVSILLGVLLDSLSKEGHVAMASEYVEKKNELDPHWVPSVRIYNILLNGWFRSRKLDRAEKLWFTMKKEKIMPTVVTYGTLIEGYCQQRHLDKAIELLQEMKREGIKANAIVYNPIIDALAECGRFKEASSLMEVFMLCESAPNLSTYNSLIKGYCKARDLAGASRVLKIMINSGFNPTPMTYNYFFRNFSKFGDIQEGMNLYDKMIQSGYVPDRLTYHLLLKMLCEGGQLVLAVQICKEMRSHGCDTDLAASTMMIHLLCKMHRFDDAFAEFENMFRRGMTPQYLTFQLLNHELRKHEKYHMAGRLCDLMSSIPHSTNLPNTFKINDGYVKQQARRNSIMRKAEAMASLLKTCNNPRKLIKCRQRS